jgi:hypothetical protein
LCDEMERKGNDTKLGAAAKAKGPKVKGNESVRDDGRQRNEGTVSESGNDLRPRS